MTLTSFLKFWLPPLLWAALIFILSSIPDLAPPKEMQFRFWDKFAHTGVYGVLGALITRAWSGTNRKYVLLGSIMAGTLYVPGRCSQISDLIADAVGSSLGAWIWLRIVRFRSGPA